MLGNCELRVRNAEFVQQLEKKKLNYEASVSPVTSHAFSCRYLQFWWMGCEWGGGMRNWGHGSSPYKELLCQNVVVEAC